MNILSAVLGNVIPWEASETKSLTQGECVKYTKNPEKSIMITEAWNSVLDQRRERPWPWGEHLRGNWSDLLNLYGGVKIKEKDASKMQWYENKEQIQGQCEMLLLVKTLTAMSVLLSADL